MLEKFLKEIVSSIAGKPAEEIVGLLDGKKYTNEFIIAKKLNLTINQTRNILYKISDQGLVSFIRKKDKRKGWYTYFWKIEVVKSLEFLRANILRKIEQVLAQIKSRETKEFYQCENCNIEITEENALVCNFTCNECGNILSRKDNTSAIREYNKELDKLKRELALVDSEFNVEKEKSEKIRTREMKKSDASALAAKKKAALERKKLKQKNKPAVKPKKIKKTKPMKKAKKKNKKSQKIKAKRRK